MWKLKSVKWHTCTVFESQHIYSLFDGSVQLYFPGISCWLLMSHESFVGWNYQKLMVSSRVVSTKLLVPGRTHCSTVNWETRGNPGDVRLLRNNAIDPQGTTLSNWFGLWRTRVVHPPYTDRFLINVPQKLRPLCTALFAYWTTALTLWNDNFALSACD